jgi:hypothetical protein
MYSFICLWFTIAIVSVQGEFTIPIGAVPVDSSLQGIHKYPTNLITKGQVIPYFDFLLLM